ncbi:MAG TPA: PqqD family protein [Thermoanaerobaculia bacterium]|nr:PqqD family protein [Thermoanaerobaculia bacterium]
MIVPESRLQRRERVLTQGAAGTLVLLDLDGGQYYALDEVSARVWELCDGERGVNAIVAVIGDEFDAPLEAIREDVLGFLQEMVDEKLLVVQES